MKKFLVVVAMVTILMVGFSTNGYTDQNERCNTMCINLGKLAKSIMKGRQDGRISLSDQLNIDLFENDEKLQKLHKALVIRAYSSPLFSTDKYKQEAIIEFENSVLIQCLPNCN